MSTGVRLALEGGDIAYDAPAGAMTGERLAELRRHKADLMRLLAVEAATSRLAPRAATDGGHSTSDMDQLVECVIGPGFANSLVGDDGASAPRVERTIDELFDALRDVDAQLYVRSGHLHYTGPPLAAQDSLRADLVGHRVLLREMFTYTPTGRCDAEGCYRFPITDNPRRCPDHRTKDRVEHIPPDARQESGGPQP